MLMLKNMKKCLFSLSFLALLPICALSQSLNISQYSVDEAFLGTGVYGQNMASSTTFTDQFTANTRIQGDLIVMPGASYTGYLGGASYNLTPLCNLLESSALSCGKFMPFVTGEAGVGRIASLTLGTQYGLAVLGEVGASYQLTNSGSLSIAFKGGYGDFGPSISGQSNKGFFYYGSIPIGLGSSAVATQARFGLMRRANAKKLKKLNALIEKAKQQN